MDSHQISIEDWVSKQLKLIKLDYDEELEQNRELRSKNSLKQLENSGHAIRKLLVTNQRSAFGRKVIQLSVRPEKRDLVNLINCGMTHGDIVGITIQDQTKTLMTGVVLHVKRHYLEIACDSDATIFDENDKFNLIQLTNDITYRRIKFALENLYSLSNKNYLIGLLFGTEPLLEPLNVLAPYSSDLPYPLGGKSEIFWFNQNLNVSQKNAIEFALYQRHLAVIHGPPGTGKTTTLTELILQMITRGLKLMVCAPSNVAVDNIFKQLIQSYQKHLCSKYRLKKNYNFIRIGHPARMDTDIQQYSLDYIVMQDGADVLDDLKSEINKIKADPRQNRMNRGQIRERQKEFDQYEEKVSKEKLREAHVIMSTCNGAVMNGALRYLYDDLSTFSFDVVIIDECAQAIEASAWIPLSYAKKCVLGGDHQQLPATITSPEAAKQGLGISLIERIVKMFNDCPEKVVRMLVVQYRMNSLIMNWPSSYFYENRLEAAESVANRQLQLNNLTEPFPVIRLIDTVGCSMYELDPDQQQGLSKGNVHEVNIVCIIIKQLIDQGVSPSDIGIISPYRLQTSMIEAGCRRMYAENITDQLEINSVDAFQGREKEVIILSLVRSNDQGSIGFLIEDRRLNVAITRARSHLTVVCDSGTVTRNCDALSRFIDYCYEHGTTESASEYQQLMDDMEDVVPVVERKNIPKQPGDNNNNNNGGGGGGNVEGKNARKNLRNAKHEAKNRKIATKKEPSKPSIIGVGGHNHRSSNDDNFVQKLKEFKENVHRNDLKFPDSLNGGQRKKIYEQCAKLGLKHETIIIDSNSNPPKKQVIVTR